MAILSLKESVIESESSESFFEKAKQDFSLGDYSKALEGFRKARTIKPEFIQAWFFEIRSLKLLADRFEERKTINVFLKEHPKFKNLPMFRAETDVK